MPVAFHILPQRNLVIARFTGHILLADCLSSAADYARHPDANPMQNQLIDLTSVASYERDFVKIMSTMAKLPDHLLKPGSQPLIVYLAPSRVSQDIAVTVLKSMSGIAEVAVSVVSDEAQALDILGLRERSIAELMVPG